MKPAPLILLILLVPLAGASFTDVRSYEWWMMQSTSATGGFVATAITVPTDPYTHTRASQQSVWDITATYTAAAVVGGGVQTFAFQVDGVAITGCTWSMTRGAIALGVIVTSESTYHIRCLHPSALTSGAHTLSVIVGGAALVTASRTDVILRQTDTITDATLDPLATTIDLQARTAYTNALINATAQTHEAIDVAKHAYQNTRANETHAHIDAHFNYTNNLINVTVGSALNLTVLELIQRIDNNVTFLKLNLNNTFTMALGTGLDSSINFTLLTIVAILVLATWLYRKEEWVYKAMGILVLLVAAIIALELSPEWPSGGVLGALVIFYAAGLAFHAYFEESKRKKKGELEV